MITESANQNVGRPSAYDVRKTVQITAPILGSVGGFVVTAIVLVLTVASHSHKDASLIALAAGLLALSLIGCLAGAFALASLAGESQQAVNLQAAAMYMSIGPTIAVVAILAAFQVLADIYIPESKGLFAVMAALAGIGGAVYNGTGIIDEWDISPGSSSWITSRAHARSWIPRQILLGASPVALGLCMYLLGATVALHTSGVTVFIAVGIIISVGCCIQGIFRTLHPDDGEDRGTKRWEAVGLSLTMGLYMGAILICLPQ